MPDRKLSTGRPGASAGGGMLRIFPDLDEDLLLDLFHKAAKAQWTSRDLDWDTSLQFSTRQREALARVLTPTYLGEQTAMVGAAAIVPQLMAAGETTAQLYLTTFMLDEARHFEALTRLYRTLGFDPMSLRDMPDMLRYHHRLRRGDRVDWVWGILISDLYAKLFYRAFAASQPQALFGQMSARFLQDESRHLAFAITYLSRNVPKLEAARRADLVDLRDDLCRLIERGMDRLRPDFDALHLDHDLLQGELWRELEQAGKRIGLTGTRPPRDTEPPTSANGKADAPPPPTSEMALAGSPEMSTIVFAEERPESLGERTRRFFAVDLPSCFSCLLVAMCRTRPAPG